MLEIIYKVLGWVTLILSGYTVYYSIRFILKRGSLDEVPVKVIDSMVNICIITGIVFGVCMAIACHLHKDGITMIIDGICSFIWLIEAKKYLKISDYLKQIGKK